MRPFIVAVALSAVACAAAVDHANWMRDLMPLIGSATLFDLTIPGSHDTMTYDLSTTVADGANDVSANISYILHDLGDVLGLGGFVRNQVCSSCVYVRFCA